MQAVATDLSYLDGLLADGSMWMDRGGNLYISWVQAREQVCCGYGRV